ncbi:MAG: RnfABCDGE type electron transport complex subunit D [Desulfohalobiaceae bacterium]
MSNLLVVSPYPHVHAGHRVSRIMLEFMLALIPAALYAIYSFGPQVIYVLAIAIISAIAWEALLQTIAGKPLSINDLSAASSGLILAMLLPPTAPWWLILVGTLVMVALGKEVFGGLGSTPFNAVLLAWVVLKISFPDHMQDWIVPSSDAASSLAPLQVFKDQGPAYVREYFSYWDLFVGRIPGQLGQVSALMLLIGGIYLLARKVISWRLPITYLAGVFLFSGLFWAINPQVYADPIFHLLAGGTFLAAFFLATDLPSTPVSPIGMIIFGLAAGILTVIIRTWGDWPFGGFYAVFIMNLATPFLDKITPEVFGRR